MFLLSKSAPAARAALGFAGYLLHGLGWSGLGAITSPGLAVCPLVTLLVGSGLQRSN